MEILEIPKQPGANPVGPNRAEMELRVKGRLDAQWADHLGRALDGIIHRGMHRIAIDASGIDYLSSAGIRVLLIYFKRLKEIKGFLFIVNPSQPVRSLLQLSGLQDLIQESVPEEGAAPESPAPAKSAAGARSPAVSGSKEVAGRSGSYEIFALDPQKTLSVRHIGHPDLLTNGGIHEETCPSLSFPADRFGLGLGAFGERYPDYRDRLGEFISAGGVTACHPAGATAPDYLIGSGDFVPEIRVVYGLQAEGGFSHLIRFEAGKETGRIGLEEIVRTALEATGSESAGIVLITENAGLVGASLRSSPAAGPDGDFFTHPAIRSRLSFTSERAYTDYVSVIAGFASRRPDRADHALEPFLRPLGAESEIKGHFHAAVLSYRPISKGKIDLGPSVAQLFQEERLQGILHLIADEREITGVGESEFIRGACWASPLRKEGER